MSDTYKFSNMSEVEELAAPTENTKVFGFEDGKPVRMPASELGSKVFIIDATADDYSTTDTAYGNKVKEALLRGDRVLYYDGAFYIMVTAFYVYESTTGDVALHVYAAGFETNGSISMTAKLYSFAITL